MCDAKPREAFAFDPCDAKDHEVVQAATAASWGCAWAKAERFDDFAVLCCGQSNLKLLSDPRSC
jgi:hypothetical protein